MFNGDCDFDIDEDFLKDVFKTAEEHVVPKRSLHSPQETVTKKLRVGNSAPPCTPAQLPDVVVAPLLVPLKAPGSSTRRLPNKCTSRQRKFPGPAGLLPDRGSSLNRTLETQSDNEDDTELPSQGLCSQPVGSVFQSDVWLRAEQDLMQGCPAASTVATCTLRWVRGKALAGHLPNLRVPLLRVALRTIDCSLEDPFVLFHDPTGQMPGTLHREVREAHEARLRPGTVLVLRQVGVLMTRRTLRNHYLNVTTNNLVSIYHTPDQLRPDHVEVAQLQEISLLEVAQSIRDIQEKRLIIDLPASHLLDHRDEHLFSSVGTSALVTGGPNRNCHPPYTRNTVPQVQNNSSVNWQKGLACMQGSSSDETSSSVSKFLSTHNYSHVPQRNENREVSSSSASAVARSRTSLNCSVSGAQDSTFGHQRSNVMSLLNKPFPNNGVSARGSGFKPKTSQLGSLGTSFQVNGWSSGVMVGDDSTLRPDVCGRVCETLCTAKAVDVDDERRIVENILDSIDPSQLFEEDF